MLLEDLLILARTIYGEARGQPFEGQKAVAHVVFNRVSSRVGDADHSIAAACLRWLQFSAWNENDPNRVRLSNVTMQDSGFRTAVRAALEAYDEKDFTLGSRHYHTKTIKPKWSEGHTPVVMIGDHVFYNDIA